PGGAVLENSFMPSFSHGLEGVKKFKLSGDEAPVRCHSERSEESRSVFLPLRTEFRARFLASLGMTAPVDFFTASLVFRLNPPRSALRAGWKAEPSCQRGGGWSRASAAERQRRCEK